MPTLRVNGTTIAYSDTGAPPDHPDAPTIVFGHGLLFSGWMFHAQIAVLRERYRCIALDWRGQGDTPPAATGGYDMDTLTSDVVAVIEALQLGPVHYVGLSMGGFVGLRLGARHGDLLRSLTLLDTSADPEEPAAARQDRLLAVVYRLIGIKPVAGKVLPLMFGPTFRDDPATKPVVDEFIQRLSRLDRGGMRKAVLAVANREPVYAEIDRIAVPTLVIVGADDTPTPPDKARRIAERVPGARLEIVADSGHSSTVEQPEAVTALLSDFLATCQPS
jgi:3-oxoadipate enol-lactonase